MIIMLTLVSCQHNIFLSNKIVIDKNKIVPLSFTQNNSFDKIDDINAHKIIAVGESMHGTKTMSEVAYDVMRHQIETNQCDLVLFEMSLSKSLLYNKYVQGDENVNIDSLIEDSRGSFLETAQFREFCVWLRNKNKNSTMKTRLLGTDCSVLSGSILDLSLQLDNYLYYSKRNSTTDSLYVKISDLFYGNKGTTDVYNFILKFYPQLVSTIGKEDSEIIKQCIKNVDVIKRLLPAKNTFEDRYAIRDSIMYENTKYLMSILQPKQTVVYMHLGHTNTKMQNIPIYSGRSYGLYMKEHYANNYFSIGILTEKGTYLAGNIKDKGGILIDTIQEPPENSLEYCLKNMKYDYFYVPVRNNNKYCYRNVGITVMREQFKYPIPLSSIDAAVFVRNSEPINVPHDLLGEENKDKYSKYNDAKLFRFFRRIVFRYNNILERK